LVSDESNNNFIYERSLVILIPTSAMVIFHLMHIDGTITVIQLDNTLIELALVNNVCELLTHFKEKS